MSDNINIEQLKEYAKEELLFLQQMLPKLPDLIKGDANSYLFLESFSCYDHLQKTTKKLSEIRSAESLLREFRIAESQLKAFVTDPSNTHNISNNLNEDFFSYLEGKLNDVIEFSEDIILYENKDNMKDDYPYDTANDFIEFFAGLYHLINFLKENNKNTKHKILQKNYYFLQEKFKKSFYHFSPLKAQFAHQKERFLSSEEEWWYTTDPDTYRPTEIATYFITSETSEKTHECHNYETIASYAFNELPYETKKDIEQHVNACSYCLNEVLNLRYAAKEIPEEPVFKPFKLKRSESVKQPDKIKEKEEQISSEFRGIVDRVLSSPGTVIPSSMPLQNFDQVNYNATLSGQQHLYEQDRGDDLEIADANFNRPIAINCSSNVDNEYPLLPSPDFLHLIQGEGIDKYQELYNFIDRCNNDTPVYCSGWLFQETGESEKLLDIFPLSIGNCKFMDINKDDSAKTALLCFSSDKEKIEKIRIIGIEDWNVFHSNAKELEIVQLYINFT